MSDWIEVEANGARVRYRDDGGDHARPASRLTVEYWHDRRREWRAVRNWSSRDWFALGMEAGKRLRDQTEMAL